MAKLLSAWRAAGALIIHIQHDSIMPNSPLRGDRPGFAFKPEVAPLPGEPVITKHVNSAFIGTDLEARLRDMGAKALVIVGLTTDHCVSTSTRMAGNLGFEVELVGDATATFERSDVNGQSISAEEMHRVNLASLHGEFCNVVTTKEVLASFSRGFKSRARYRV